MYERQQDEAPMTQRPHVVAMQTAGQRATGDEEKALPLPGWLVKLYFIFPIILFVPDAIFNFFVYSDGVGVAQDDNPVLAVGKTALWAFMSLGIVGMAYLLSVLAPWHWMLGHRIQAFFCAVGVVIATGITTWNSLAFRSTNFAAFKTDDWAYALWPQLQQQHISLTMIVAAVAPPFWGLFWAIVQPTQTRKSLAHLQGSHQERMLKMRQDAEAKALKAEVAATVREAQLKGMALTAATAREQAGVVAQRWRGKATPGEGTKGEPVTTPATPPVSPLRRGGTAGMEREAVVAGAPRLPAARPTPRGAPVPVGAGDPISGMGVTPAHVTTPAERALGSAAPRQRRGARTHEE